MTRLLVLAPARLVVTLALVAIDVAATLRDLRRHW